MVISTQHRAIGLFDSGIGGLTVMQQIMQKLPQESLIYFGDTARLPYGGKSQETVLRYSIENAIFLMDKGIKLLVVACNTASAFALERLRQIFNIPVIGVIEPGAEKAAAVTRHQRIAILGTKGTIQSGAYQTAIRQRLPDAALFPIACPLFVPLVEENFLHHPAAQLVVKEYLRCLQDQQIDTILLGCTHYPLLKTLIEEELGPDIAIVDSASTCAEKVAAILDDYQIASSSSDVSYQYYVSDDPNKFSEQGHRLFGHQLPSVELVSNLLTPGVHRS